MTVQHHHATHRHMTNRRKTHQFWLKEEIILGAVAAFLAFALIYANADGTGLIYPFAGSLSMGAIIYAATWKVTHRRH